MKKKMTKNKVYPPKSRYPSGRRKVKFELSAGGLVINLKSGKILVVRDQKNRITFPKGLVEAKEKVINAAVREVKEETGIKNLELVEKLGEVKFLYQFQGKLIFKKIIYFLFKTKDQRIKPQNTEIKDALWLSINEILKNNPFKNLNPIINKAIKFTQLNSFRAPRLRRFNRVNPIK